jgi:hypothetical protein
MAAIDPLTAGAVLLATAATDAVYVMFTSAVVARKRVPAATWSSVWYVLSSYAVISYTENWVYIAFAAAGSWVGAYLTITFLHRPPGGPPVGRRRSEGFRGARGYSAAASITQTRPKGTMRVMRNPPFANSSRCSFSVRSHPPGPRNIFKSASATAK